MLKKKKKKKLPVLCPNPSTHHALLLLYVAQQGPPPHLSHMLSPHLSRSDGRSTESGEQNQHSARSLLQTHSCCDKAWQILRSGCRQPTSRVLSCPGHAHTLYSIVGTTPAVQCITKRARGRLHGCISKSSSWQYSLARKPSTLQHHVAQPLASHKMKLSSTNTEHAEKKMVAVVFILTLQFVCVCYYQPTYLLVHQTINDTHVCRTVQRHRHPPPP